MKHAETLATQGEAALEAHGASKDEARAFMKGLKIQPVVRVSASGFIVFVEPWGDPLEALRALWDQTVSDRGEEGVSR